MKKKVSSAARPPTLIDGSLRSALNSVQALRQDPLAVTMAALALNEPIVHFGFGPVSMFYLFDPEDMRRVLVDECSVYTKKTRGHDMVRSVVGQGLFTSEGEFWRRQRRIA